MVNLRGLTAKARQLARRNPDKVEQALNRAGDFVDQRTGRRYGRHVDTVQQKARTFLDGGRTSEGPPSGERPGDPGSVQGTGDGGPAERSGGTPDAGGPGETPRP